MHHDQSLLPLSMQKFAGPTAPDAYVIYHAHCSDGFGAAWAFMQRASSHYYHAHYHAMNYGEEPHYADMQGKDVFILDFSFPAHILADIAEVASHTVLLDHHKTAIETLTALPNPIDRCDIILDDKRSGAMLAWNYFAPTEDAPQLIAYVQDRDLWKHSLPWTKEINALIQFTDKTEEAYTALHKSFVQGQFYSLTTYGELLLKQQQRHVSSIIAATKRPFRINTHAGLICNCPGQFSSDIGNELAKETGTFGATYFAAADGSHKFSLRSIGDFDVSRIAKDFGGGGHKNAAGFVIHAPLEDAGGSGITLWNIPESAYEET